MTNCPFCSFENLPAAAFCVNCGRELPRPRPSLSEEPMQLGYDADRRFVTILFADLSGFTALTETRDPETVREVINAYFDTFVPIIEARHGVVDQFVGDAIVALFGAPVAHEDDAAQACRAALELMRALEGVNARRQLALGLHIGINSGTVLAGAIGTRGRQQYSVLGDAVNMASRLQDAAAESEIFVGAETYNLTSDQFEYVARGAMSFKGKSEPQDVWQLTGAAKDAPLHRRIRTTTPLLGRKRELALLKRVTNELEDETPRLHIVSILGEAGLGKSRLVQEWRELAMDGAVPPRFVVAACATDGASRAYALVAEMARVLLDVSSAPNGGSVSLAALLGKDVAASLQSAPDSTSLETEYVNALRDLMRGCAASNVLVLVCEDMHWADEPSLRVLVRVLEQLTETRLLLGFTLRLERQAPMWDLIEHSENLPGAATVRLNLSPLAEDDAHALVSALLPGTVPPHIEQLVLTQAEGNPLFLEELVCMLLERGDLELTDEAWMLTRNLMALDVPTTLQGVLMARVDQLAPEARHLLQIAAVLGREFPLEDLEEMLARLE